MNKEHIVFIGFIFMWSLLLHSSYNPAEAKFTPIEAKVEVLYLGHMTATSYRSVTSQTDSTPFITADGSHVTPHGTAVSRNLLKRWGGPLNYGDIIYIDKIGYKVVNDTMNKRHKNHVDIWVGTLREEINFHAEFKSQKLKVWKLQGIR